MIYFPLMKTEFDLSMYRRSLHHSAKQQPEDGDIWSFDAPYYKAHETGSYDDFFRPLLQSEGCMFFEELLVAQKNIGLSTHVLDLFGGGFFLENLDSVDSITGVRLQNPTEEMFPWLEEQKTQPNLSEHYKTVTIPYTINRLQTLTASPKWSIVEGNLFTQDTWNKLDKQGEQKGITDYSLITIKPESALYTDAIFDSQDIWKRYGNEKVNQVYSLKYLQLLDRSYSRLSGNHGMLFTEVPEFLAGDYLDGFVDTIKTGTNIGIDVMNSIYDPKRKNMLLHKQPDSPRHLARTVRDRYRAA